MARLPTDYFRYFPPHPDAADWGIDVVGCGIARTKAGAIYPPQQHPSDHHFDWDHGRVLENLQLVLVTSGCGRFESRDSGRKDVVAGTGFLLSPGAWHRYAPDEKTGWTESWLELRGPVVDALLKSGALLRSGAVHHDCFDAGLDSAMDALHQLARRADAGFDPEMSAHALRILAAWMRAEAAPRAQTRMARAIREAERYFAERHTEPINVAQLARKLGVDYSHFRRAFKDQTGFSPWNYVVQLRLARARRLLASGDATLEDIAARLGYSSGFHFSSAFKQAFGVSPQHWRKQLRLESEGVARADD